MRLAFIQGYFSSQTRGPYRVNDLRSHDLSGSESFFFNMVRELGRLGHEVEAYGFWTLEHREDGVRYIPFRLTDNHASLHLARDASAYDAAISWNEPDYLSVFPSSVKRVCVQQLNDFSYCKTDFKAHTDLFLLPSARHMAHLLAQDGLDPAKCAVFSNWISNEDNFSGAEDHANHKMVYCSSPDRGLHWLAEFFPKVRARVPDAELHIYYRVDSWLSRFAHEWPDKREYKEMSFRARYIMDFARRWGPGHGVFFEGPVSNTRMASVLQTSRMLTYPCDTVCFTEGFGVSVLDACLAGAYPLISDVDAFGSVYGGEAHVIPGRPGGSRKDWVDAICTALTDDQVFAERTARTRLFAQQFTRASRAGLLLSYLLGGAA